MKGKAVVDGDDRIDALEADMEQTCLSAIAQRGIEMGGQPCIKPLEDLPRSTPICMEMLSDALRSFRESNPGLAQ